MDSSDTALIPLDLWRAGGEERDALMDPRVPPSRVPDIEVFTRGGQEWVRHITDPPAGLSLWDGPMPMVRRGWWWVIPKGTPIPTGLRVVKARHRHKTGFWHYTVVPANDMPLSAYRNLLRLLTPHAVIQYACS